MKLNSKFYKKGKREISFRFFLLNTAFANCHLLLVVGVVFVFLFNSSCRNPETINSTQNYFSLHDFFKEEELRLASAKVILKKVNQLQLTKDSTLVQNPDWQKELALFVDADMNKPAWKNSFTIDSIKNDSSLILTYTAIEKKITIRRVVISFVNQKVKTIQIKKANANFVYTSNQNLWYTPKSGFKLEGHQKIVWFFETSYAVEATFIVAKKP